MTVLRTPGARFEKLPGYAFAPRYLGQPHQTISNAGHFLQADCGAELAEVIAGFIAR